MEETITNPILNHPRNMIHRYDFSNTEVETGVSYRRHLLKSIFQIVLIYFNPLYHINF